MSNVRFARRLWVAIGVAALLLGAATTHAQQYDDPQQPYAGDQADAASDQAPGRVARLAYLSGQVQFAPAGETDWGSADINRPMVIGDRLLTGTDGRAVLELGDASVRIDNESAFDFLNLAQGNVQIELSQGTLNLAVRQLDQGANYEVDTPTVAFVAATPGVYRIDDDPTGTGSMVTVFQGSGTVYGENGVSRQVVAGTSYRFNDSALASVDVTGIPQPDAFDRFCEARDATYSRYAQQPQQYVPPDMIGGDDLYQYGQWNDVPQYGNVWYPTAVPVGWAPYRYGHWAWIDPWGWTWVDDAPWGFAPFHYGRWAYIGSRWGWIPGPVNVRPLYAPALVAFVGGAGWSVSLNFGGGGPVGWFPLGPRDVYTPWFRASRGYFTNVNVTNIRNVYVNRTVINNYYSDYSAGRAPPRGGRDYAYRTLPGAVTAVPRNVFTGARPVRPAVLRLDRTQLARTEVAVRPNVNPDRASLGLRNARPQPTVLRDREPFARPVVARQQPPPRPVEFAAREKVIASQHGEPLTNAQLQNLRQQRPAPTQDHARVKLVPALAGAAAGAAAIGALERNRGEARPTAPRNAAPIAAPRPAEPAPQPRTGPAAPGFRNTVRPIQAPVAPVREQPQRPNELPSARFVPSRGAPAQPRPPVIQPAREPQRSAPPERTLPVVRPIERAPQPTGAPQARPVDTQAQQREAQVQAQQRAREASLEQQRAAQAQARQREAQEAQQRQAQLQAQQREAQMQQAEARQRQAQLQAQQREAQMQQAQAQQRQAQMQAQQREAQMQAQQRMREQSYAQPRPAPQPREVPMQRAPQYRAPPQRSEPPASRREPPPSRRPPDDSGHPLR